MQLVFFMRSNSTLVIMAVLTKRLFNSAHRLLNGLSFPVIVNKLLSLAADKSAQIIDLLNRRNIAVWVMALNAVFFHSFIHYSVGSPLNLSGWHFGRFCLASPGTVCSLTEVNVSINWLLVMLIGINVIKDQLNAWWVIWFFSPLFSSWLVVARNFAGGFLGILVLVSPLAL